MLLYFENFVLLKRSIYRIQTKTSTWENYLLENIVASSDVTNINKYDLISS